MNQKSINLNFRVGLLEKILFTKHLSVMIRSGVSIFEALDTIASSITNLKFKKILYEVLKEIENGKNLSDALAKHPRVFDKFYTSLVEVSEDSGTLEETLHYLAEQLSKEYALRKKIQGAMFYPSLIIIMSFGIGSFISLFVLPQLVDFFSSLDIPLPLPTRILLWFSNLMKFHGIWVVLSIFTLFIVFRFIISIKTIKPYWQQLLIRMPIAGKLIIYTQLTRFTRNLGTLTKSGVPLAIGLGTVADTLSIISFKKHANEVERSLIEGKSISETLSKANYLEFPPMTIKMIAIGEKTGTLEEVLIYLSNFYEEEVDEITKNLGNVIEPVMLIGIGLLVAFLALAIIGLIYEVTGSISQ